MKCTQCMYEENCSLREIAKDLTGCMGHSALKPPREGYYQCCGCKAWYPKDKIFLHKDGKHHLCFNCY